LADPDLKSAAFRIVIGGFLPLLAVPFLEKYVAKSKYHTVVGDHEDLKKNLRKKHKSFKIHIQKEILQVICLEYFVAQT
jgi:hypothetical protein